MSGVLAVAAPELGDALELGDVAPLDTCASAAAVGASGVGALCQSPDADHSGELCADDHWAGAANHCDGLEVAALGCGALGDWPFGVPVDVPEALAAPAEPPNPCPPVASGQLFAAAPAPVTSGPTGADVSGELDVSLA